MAIPDAGQVGLINLTAIPTAKVPKAMLHIASGSIAAWSRQSDVNCVTAINTATPVTKPVNTGAGMNSINLPARAACNNITKMAANIMTAQQ